MINDAASVITNAGGTILNGAQDLADATPFGSAVKGEKPDPFPVRKAN